MPKPEHLKILQKGKKAWNKWRKKHPDESPNLYKAELMEMDLRDANLTGADLSEANLSGADLTGTLLADAANLTPQQLSSAVLDGDAQPDPSPETVTQAPTDTGDEPAWDQEQPAAETFEGTATPEPSSAQNLEPVFTAPERSAVATLEKEEIPEEQAVAENLEPAPILEEPPGAETLETEKATEPVVPETFQGTPTDLVPTHSDDPTEIDELGGRPFAQILGERIHEV